MTSLSVPTGDPDDSDDEPFINCIAVDPSSRFLRIVEAGRPRRAYEPTLPGRRSDPAAGDPESILLWRRNISTRRAGLLARSAQAFWYPSDRDQP